MKQVSHGWDVLLNALADIHQILEVLFWLILSVNDLIDLLNDLDHLFLLLWKDIINLEQILLVDTDTWNEIFGHANHVI